MARQNVQVGMVAALLALIGCRASVDTRPPPRATENISPSQTRVRTDSENIRDYALAIQNSRDRIEEADVLRRLSEYMGDRDLTFNVAGVRALDDGRVQMLSSSPDRLRVRVDVYRGQQPVQSFTFIPRDNRNLTLLGA